MTHMLDIWERGAAWHSIDRALLILQYACPGETYQRLSEFTLGQRDTLLLQIREKTFGDRIESYVECPSCSERLEFGLSCDILLADAALPVPGRKKIEHEGIEWELRAPTSVDLAAVVTAEHASAATKMLLARCATRVTEIPGASGPAPESLPESLSEAIAALDPQAEIRIALTCQACTHAWQSDFDIASFIWSEICARGRRLLQEIDVLARRYGWSEADILRMSDTRRGLHVQMALS